ncbi:cytochrome c maturation protein CcmE [Altererythrobacter salegens]|uniref:Cytochrome c-type biogenesis protein CcmE n=1 Tax=Croceibacterium salegens TaxID=1737568 RepID=A0A6I4SVQ6_9SPHN|nr:cytochrome c maturation protein CcmE [Croceibacterium salegens]MXO59618.1 cytochrome c maturation protein CcmE [Croceibacterium salegens]
MTARLKPKHQRLVLVIVALVAIIGAGVLAAWGLRNQASFYLLPNELVADPPAAGQAVRLGGMVEAGSLRTDADGITVHFIVGDGEAKVPVTYSGILPDLFQEGSGVTADGSMGADGVFHADGLLAKHDEKYVPRELKDMTEAQKHQVVAEATE